MTDTSKYVTKEHMIDKNISRVASDFPNHNDILTAAGKMILSASGWRKVFAEDGNEESASPRVSRVDLLIAETAALVFARLLQEEADEKPAVVFVGCDARPTGPVLMEGMNRIFLALGLEVKAVGLSAAPELMAAVKLDDRASGFLYISASHNPVGHNGFKFGGPDGAVYGGDRSAKLIDDFRAALADPESLDYLAGLRARVEAEALSNLSLSREKMKKTSLERYYHFSRRVISGFDSPEKQENFFRPFARTAARHPIGIIAELNGSARGASIDRDFLRDCGILTEVYNGEPGKIVHPIVPEGASLDLCRTLLADAHRRNPAFLLGYVPDNDGDRGNLVYFDSRRVKTRAMTAQEVFALAVLSELAYDEYLRGIQGDTSPMAVAVNGPTSMRIEEIASVYGAEVFRSEVGEANVVNLAAELRGRGFRVRILGEGSNGGNITHPSTVRDPLNTIFSILRLLSYRGEESDFAPFHDWCRRSGREKLYRNDFDLADIMDALPVYTTTGAYEPEALMRIRCEDHRLLKEAYEREFLSRWERVRDELRSRYGITGWREINYEGTRAKTGFGPDFRSGKARGGLKIAFFNKRGRDTDFIWMRGSGTEPVFRIMADSRGDDKERHDMLLNLQREMIEAADRKCTGTIEKEAL